MKALDNERFKNIIFALDSEKPILLRYDTVKNSRIKIALVFTADSTRPFPNLFQFVFFRPINRMFVVGGSDRIRNKAESWEVLQVR